MVTPLFQGLSFPLIVLDLEWNQQYAGQQADLSQEIVEIGAVKMDEGFQIVDTLGTLVRPVVHTRMHHHVRRLTGISTSESKQGVPFVQAAGDFLAFCGEAYTICTWGRDDLPVLWKNFEFFGMPMPRFTDAVNLQMAYDQLLSATPALQASLQKAMEALDVTVDLPAHRALNDALFTAQVLRRMEQKFVKDPPQAGQVKQLREAFYEQVLRLSEQRAVLPTAWRRVQDIWADEALTGCACPICKGDLSPQTPVFSAGHVLRSQQLLSCQAHGDVLTLLHAQKLRSGFFRLHKRCMLTSSEHAEKVRHQLVALPPPKARKPRHKPRKTASAGAGDAKPKAE